MSAGSPLPPKNGKYVSDSNSSVAPSAGWYADPEHAGQLRYWDGSAWTEHRTPAAAAVSQAQGSPDMTYAWTLAFTPVIWLLIDVLLLQVVGGGDLLVVSNAAAIGVTVALSVLDSKALAKAGVRLSAWWGALLLPVYLILRTKRAGSTAAIPVVWFVLAVGYAAASTPVMYALEDAGYSASPSSSADGVFDDTWSDPLESYTCDELADEAVALSEEERGVSLLKVRGLRTIEDNTWTYSLPSGSKESLVLACRGTGVWSDGDTSTEVRLELTVDADGDSWIAYKPVW